MRKYLYAVLLMFFLLPALTSKAQTDTLRQGNFDLRTNLLYDAFIVPTLGVEWRINDAWGIKLDGSWTYWCSYNGKLQDIWLINPELRRYIGEAKRLYFGLGANAGGYNIYKLGLVAKFLNNTGYKGTLWNGGVVAGYQARLYESLFLDFNIGLGYNSLKYDSFTMIRCETCTYREYKEKNVTDNWFGPTQAGISLIWRIGQSKKWPVSAPATVYIPQVPEMWSTEF